MSARAAYPKGSGCVALVLASSFGCSDFAQRVVEYDAVVVPDAEVRADAGLWTVELVRADVAFGPVYFCAAASGSSTLCGSAAAEVTTTALIDGASPVPQPLGRVRGFTGPVRSASYNFGISWFETSNAPTADERAPGGHSMQLEAIARREDATLRVTADVDVVPQYQGQTAVPTSPAEADLNSSEYRLEVRWRTIDWFLQLDWDELAARGDAEIHITSGSDEHNALLIGIKNLAPPEFTWAPLR